MIVVDDYLALAAIAGQLPPALADQSIATTYGRVYRLLRAITSSQTSGQLEPRHFQELLTIFRDTHKTMRRMLKEAKDMELPALKNLPVGQSVRPFLLEGELIDGLSKYEQRLSERWINDLVYQFNQMKSKVDRIHFKSLAGILALQEKVGNECARRWASLPQVKPVSVN